MARRILGMGDVLTLIEKAQESVDADTVEKMSRHAPGELTLDDFLVQMQQMKKMGGIKNLIGMLPGANRLGDVDVSDDALKKPEAIIRSMTAKERRNPNLLNASRRKRIAAGSGTTVQDVNSLMRQFDQARDMMKRMMGNKGMARRMMRNFK